MEKYHVVAEGYNRLNFDPLIRDIPQVDPEQQKFLDDFVAQKKKQAEESGGVFFDGDLVGVVMNSLQPGEDSLKAQPQNIKYSQHAALFRGKHDSPVQAFYVNGLMITNDNYLLLGQTQATEAQWMGKLGIPAGALAIGPDGEPSPGTQALREFQEEVGISIDHHVLDKTIYLGWINGMSQREGNYHLTQSYICPLKFSSDEMLEYFHDWKNANEKLGIKTEFSSLDFIPNEPRHIRKFIEEQDRQGKNARLLGKSLDVLQAYEELYNCDLEKLKESKTGARVYLPQPKIE